MSVVSIYALPDVLYSKLHTTTVSMREDNGTICIEPVVKSAVPKKGMTVLQKLRGMFFRKRMTAGRSALTASKKRDKSLQKLRGMYSSDEQMTVARAEVAAFEKNNKALQKLRKIFSDGRLTLDSFEKMMREDKERYES